MQEDKVTISSSDLQAPCSWVPAFAGMTSRSIYVMGRRSYPPPPKLRTSDPATSAHPSTSTKKMIFIGSDIVGGGSITAGTLVIEKDLGDLWSALGTRLMLAAVVALLALLIGLQQNPNSIRRPAGPRRVETFTSVRRIEAAWVA